MAMGQYTFPPWWDYLYQHFQDFIAWFVALDTVAQIFAGIGIFLLCLLAWGIVYGVFQFALEIVKFSLIVTVIIHYLLYLGLKLSIVAVAKPKEVDKHWDHGVDNIKWILKRAYPKEYLKSEQFIERQVVFKRPAPPTATSQVVVVKADAKLHCTNCGSPFSGRMNQLAQSREYVYCENCGQVFVLPDSE
ncbi:MAG: hypothetical protein EU530_07540 [Promethearchaeota archaeon]|nr:MAG: hypothetical protein EU530_07540 [Candidatus Lokiarchaeota archaeon]